MYQFVLSKGVPIPFVLQQQYPAQTILLETPPEDNIKQYHECLLFVKMKEDLDAAGDFTIFNKISDEVNIFRSHCTLICLMIFIEYVRWWF